jgi:hypothetical protein
MTATNKKYIDYTLTEKGRSLIPEFKQLELFVCGTFDTILLTG